MSDSDGSVVEANAAPTADPTSSRPQPPATPTFGRDLARALLCAAFVAASCDSPATAVVVAPIVPVLVAYRLLIGGAGTARFLALATGASVLAAVAVVLRDASIVPAALTSAIALTIGLGAAHVAAVRPRRDSTTRLHEHSPGAADVPTARDVWPEPSLRDGWHIALAAWLLTLVLAFAALGLGIGELRELEAGAVRAGYPYIDECRAGGVFERQTEFCDNARSQRDGIIARTNADPAAYVGGVVALLALACAATAHLLLGWSARRARLVVRPAWSITQFEAHWSMAYVTTGGLMMLLTAGEVRGSVHHLLQGVGAAATMLGGALIAAHGLGTMTAILRRRRSPTWYRVLLVVVAVVASLVAVGTLFILGMIDLALRLRRREQAAAGPSR